MENQQDMGRHEPAALGASNAPPADAEPSAAFTPGPWVSRGRYVGTPNHMSFIAECRDQNGNWSDTPHSIANARLIAAAPDLLEALKNLWLRTTVGSDAERVAALTVAGDLLARLGALEATGADQ